MMFNELAKDLRLVPLKIDKEVFKLGLNCFCRPDDPLNIYCFEEFPSGPYKTATSFSRTLQTFMWSLRANRKQHLVTAIMFVSNDWPEEEELRLTRLLASSCRLRFVRKEIPLDELLKELDRILDKSVLSIPLGRKDSSAALEQIAEGANKVDATQRELLDYARTTASSEECANAIQRRMANLLKEVQNAAKQA